MLITENIPQSIRALRGRAGILKIDCLLNARPGRLQACTGRGGVRAQNAVPSKEQKRCCTEDTAACSRTEMMTGVAHTATRSLSWRSRAHTKGEFADAPQPQL